VGDMLDPVFVFRLCGKLHTLRKQHRLVHIVGLSRKLSSLLSLGIFDMVFFVCRKLYVCAEFVVLKLKIGKKSITAKISHLILKGPFINF
jgi:hypothetical protein